MSILLEALRKSEKNQQTQEVPSIHQGDQVGMASEPLQTGPLALLLVVSLFISGWFVWQQYRPPVGYQPPVTLPANKVRSVNVQPTEDGVVSPVASSTPAANSSARAQRTPVEAYQQPTTNERPAKVVDSGTVVDNGSNTSPVNNRNKQPVSGTPTTDAATAKPKTQEPYQPQRPAPISYWELPDAIRADVPEIKFSVLVYATDPANRFVLINGQRLNEGDSAQAGLVVKEIRLDGVVFSYRLYQFLVEK